MTEVLLKLGWEDWVVYSQFIQMAQVLSCQVNHRSLVLITKNCVTKEEFFRIPHYCFNTSAWIPKQLCPFLPFLFPYPKGQRLPTSTKEISEKKTPVHYLIFTYFDPYLFFLEPCSEIFWCSVFQRALTYSSVMGIYSYLLPFIFWKLKSLKTTDYKITYICCTQMKLLSS